MLNSLVFFVEYYQFVMFDCGNILFDNWFKQCVCVNQVSGVSCIYVVVDDDWVVGYYVFVLSLIVYLEFVG